MGTHLHAFRLSPGQDLKQEIALFAQRHELTSGWVMSCVGSLTTYNIRFANNNHGTTAQGHVEILSLNGTVSSNGLHLHIAVSDANGQVIGGHLLDGNIIYTTAEIIIGSSTDYEFLRAYDPQSGFKELVVRRIDK